MTEKDSMNSVLKQLLIFVEGTHNHDMIITVKLGQTGNGFTTVRMNPASLMDIIRNNNEENIIYNILSIEEIFEEE